MLATVDSVRLHISPKLDTKRKSQLGQFLTPATVAGFMASLFPTADLSSCRLLDAGAGVGSLTSAFLDRWEKGGFTFKDVTIDAYEIDDLVRQYLEENLSKYSDRLALQINVHATDFIEASSDVLAHDLFSPAGRYFTHAILNPPYKKISSDSNHRRLLRRAGIETVNLYSAFVALAVSLLDAQGVLVAIIPRSFCNGPYYRLFREYLLERSAIRHIHLFASRDKAFKDDDVLQENVIIMLERGGAQNDVIISTSTDDAFFDYRTDIHPFDRIVYPDDPERVIHVPTSTDINFIDGSSSILNTLDDIDINVSTGPVVDFRVREHLRSMPEQGCVPLLYPCHFVAQSIEWPKVNSKKPNAIEVNEETKKWLYPNGFYVVTRRLSSKEEKRRIVASVVNPAAFQETALLGFENHLNVFHEHKHGLPEFLARGLAVFLSSSSVDVCFRRFSGHTQVNATDLKLMKYPSRAFLIALGEWAKKQSMLTQEIIDTRLEKLLNESSRKKNCRGTRNSSKA